MQGIVRAAVDRLRALDGIRIPRRQQSEVPGIRITLPQCWGIVADAQVQPLAILFPAILRGQISANQFGDSDLADA